MKKIRTKLSNLTSLFKRLSFGAFCALCLHKALRRLSKNNAVHYYHFYRQPIKARNQQERQRRSAFSFDWHESFSPLMQQLPRPEHRLRDRFLQKTSCLLGTKGDKIISCAWFAYGSYEEDEVWCQYNFSKSEQTVWDYDIFVDPKYRLGRAFYVTWQTASADLYTRGFRSTLSRISAYNPNSIKSHEKLGAQHCGSALFLKLARVQLMVSNKHPFLHCTTSKEKRPILYFE